jgi:hypothetical protein
LITFLATSLTPSFVITLAIKPPPEALSFLKDVLKHFSTNSIASSSSCGFPRIFLSYVISSLVSIQKSQ